MSSKIYPDGSARLYIPLPHDVKALLDEVARELNTTPGRFVAMAVCDQAAAFRDLLAVVRQAKAGQAFDLAPLTSSLTAKGVEAIQMAGELDGKTK